MAAEIKKLACCTVCDEPIFEVAARHTDGPLKGEVKQVSNPLPGVRRVYIVRISGSSSFWSLCPTCEIEPAMLPLLAKKELRAMVREKQVQNHTPEQVEMNEKMLRLLEYDIPLGVLGEKPWSEVA
jgi:hypothetical protein